jgi:hypothetical protein
MGVKPFYYAYVPALFCLQPGDPAFFRPPQVFGVAVNEHRVAEFLSMLGRK